MTQESVVPTDGPFLGTHCRTLAVHRPLMDNQRQKSAEPGWQYLWSFEMMEPKKKAGPCSLLPPHTSGSELQVPSHGGSGCPLPPWLSSQLPQWPAPALKAGPLGSEWGWRATCGQGSAPWVLQGHQLHRLPHPLALDWGIEAICSVVLRKNWA